MLPLLCFVTQAHAQDSACELILQQGLYKHYNFVNTGSFDRDLKNYFASDTFRSDFESHKWGGALSAVVDAVPIKLGADADNTQVKQFQQKVQQSTTFHVDQAFYAYASTSVPDVELAKVYSDCLSNSAQTGFRIFSTTTDNSVQFVVRYARISASDAMPKVTVYEVRNNAPISCTQSFSVGSTLNEASVIACPRNPNYDLSLTLETDHGVETARVPAAPQGYNKDLPVGTVISSTLDFSAFSAVTKNNDANAGGNFWTAVYSKWAPADGRQVLGSAYARAVSVNSVPDLRGVFIRGLNVFDPSETSHNGRDPDSRTVGSYQGDQFAAHDHGGGNHHHATALQNGAAPQYGGIIVRKPGSDFAGNPEAVTTDSGTIIQSQGGPETRPRNVSLFFYIRIN